MLTNILKEQTKDHHQKLESLIISRVKSLDSKLAYANFLKLFYGFIAPLEEKIASIKEVTDNDKINNREKAWMILQDINYLNPHDNNFQTTDNLPQINTFDEAIGALYVLEGSTLGGKYIRKMIASRLQMPENEGFLYFSSYADNTDNMWKAFKNVVDALPHSAEIEDNVLKSANETFIKFKRWIDEHQ